MAIRVLLDTSILLTSLKQPFDIMSETEELLQTKVEFIILRQVQNELQKLATNQTTIGNHASRALEITRKCRLIDLGPTSGTSADEALIKASKELRAIVATADSRLRMRLRTLKLPVLSLRGNRLYCEPETPQYWPSML